MEETFVLRRFNLIKQNKFKTTNKLKRRVTTTTTTPIIIITKEIVKVLI